MLRKKLVVGNWKMHGLSSDIEEVKAIAQQSLRYPRIGVALCLPATLIERAVRAAPNLAIGGQDAHLEETGPHTGCVSAQMLADAGASLTIVGHSERRQGQHETDEDVRGKAQAALAAGLDVILCVGETMAAREASEAIETVIHQLDESLPQQGGAAIPAASGPALAIAYEPIWAIGSGRVPSPSEITEMHAAIRLRLADRHIGGRHVPLLYGGSVNPANARKIFSLEQVDGVLVGGASLKCPEFMAIVAAASAAAERARSAPFLRVHQAADA
jgi:triosephosphate isomerase (TIM)